MGLTYNINNENGTKKHVQDKANGQTTLKRWLALYATTLTLTGLSILLGI